MDRVLDIILFSPGQNFVYRLRLSLRAIIILLGLFFIITFGAIGLLIHNTNISVTELKNSQAIKENEEYLSKLSIFKSELDKLHTRIGSQIAEDTRQREFLQLAQIHPDVWSMGMGGRKSKSISKGITPSTAGFLEQIYGSLGVLNNQLRLRNRSIKEMEDEFNKKFDLYRHIPSINPIPGTNIGSGFGYRVDPIDNTIRMHDGVDLGAPTGTPILATADGIVKYADWNMGYGYVVDIDHGYGFLSRYAHCSKILVRVGDFVKRGQAIGLVGATGRTTCPHLHYEVHVSGIKVNPADYINFTEVIFD